MHNTSLEQNLGTNSAIIQWQPSVANTLTNKQTTNAQHKSPTITTKQTISNKETTNAQHKQAENRTKQTVA